MKQLPSDIPDAIRDDCLHCMLWAAIGKFCREHPGHDSEDLLTSLAAVIGDQLVSPGSAPLQDEFHRHHQPSHQATHRVQTTLSEAGQ